MCFDDLTPAVDGEVGSGVPALVHLLQARGDVGGGKSHPGNMALDQSLKVEKQILLRASLHTTSVQG